MARVDPLLLLTFLGLVGCGALGVLHPPESLDPDDPLRQAGRIVTVRLEVLTADARKGVASGMAAHADAPGRVVSWVWFRPPEPAPLPGDLVSGRALVQRDAGGVQLVLDGPAAASVLPGPNPIPVRWRELVGTPERFEGRLLVLNAQVVDGQLHDPTGEHTCRLADADVEEFAGRLLVRLLRIPDGFAWACSVEGTTP